MLKVIGKKQTTPAETPIWGLSLGYLCMFTCLIFKCIPTMFVLICIGNVINKLIYGTRVHQNTWGRVSQA